MSPLAAEARQHGAGTAVLDALRLIAAKGGERTDRSRHQEKALWIYSFPSHPGAQLAVPLNANRVTFYIRGGEAANDAFEEGLQPYVLRDGIHDYRGEKGAHTALKRAPGLTLDAGRLLRLRVDPAQTAALLDYYLSRGSTRTAPVPAARVAAAASRAVDPDALRRQLDRKDAIGRAGERVAYLAELQRLATEGCPDPVSHVRIVADENVAAGYDLRSEWAGEVRCIEVKSSTAADGAFFLTQNERAVLGALGAEAWLYRVAVEPDTGTGEVLLRMQDPIRAIPDEAFKPVVWKVDPAVLDVG